MSSRQPACCQWQKHRTHGVTKDALDALYLYSEVLEDLEEDIRTHAQLGSNPVHFIESINAMRGMMTLGWVRSRLTRAAQHAAGRGAKVIELQDIIDSQSYAPSDGMDLEVLVDAERTLGVDRPTLLILGRPTVTTVRPSTPDWPPGRRLGRSPF